MKKRVVLGVSHSHDSGAVLLVDGVPVGAVNEERFSRKKQETRFPDASIAWLLQHFGVSSADVDHVAIAGTHLGDAPTLRNDMAEKDGNYRASTRAAQALDRLPGGSTLLSAAPSLSLYRALMNLVSQPRVQPLKQALQSHGILAPVSLHDHHECHVASAYYTSGLKDCLVISNDGFGDGLSTLIARGRNGSLDYLQSVSFSDSLGVLYGYATNLCGFPMGHHAGKTTGLAARGDWQKTIDVFREAIVWQPERGRWRVKIGVFGNALGWLRQQLTGVSREDIAAGVQKRAEELLVLQAQFWLKHSGEANLVLTGGVHANVRANQAIAETGLAQRIYVFPNMGDGGLAMGAAFLGLARVNGPVQPIMLSSAYLGPSYSEVEIEAQMKGHGVSGERPAELADAIAELLAQGKICARFDGALEYGPRALGNRSILYPATDPTANDWLNHQLGRSEFMPFAPVIRDIDAPAMLDGWTDCAARSAEFMTITYPASAACRAEAPACVHVDGTMRPQILRREVNPGYYDILSAYKARTGRSVLVNTSFNMHEEPIVCSPDDAIRAFKASNIDALILGERIIRRAE